MRKFLLAACAVLTMTGVARGEESRKYAQVGAWGIDAVKSKPGNFCMSSAYFPHNETTLAFGVGVGGGAVIQIVNQKWSIPEGDYPIRSAIDGSIPANFESTANGASITWKFGLNENNISLLSKGSVLNVYIGGATYQYGLGGTAAMFPELIKCAAKLSADTNPFSGQSAPSAAPVQTPANPFKRT